MILYKKSQPEYRHSCGVLPLEVIFDIHARLAKHKHRGLNIKKMKIFFAAIVVALFVIFSSNSASAQFKKNQTVGGDSISLVVNNHIELQAAPACSTFFVNNREVVRHDTIVLRTGTPAGKNGQKNSFQSFKESAQFGLDSFKDGANFGVVTYKDAWTGGYAAGLAAGQAKCCPNAAPTPTQPVAMSDNPLFWWVLGLATALLALLSYWVGRATAHTPPPTNPPTPPAGGNGGSGTTPPPTIPPTGGGDGTPPVVATETVDTTKKPGVLDPK